MNKEKSNIYHIEIETEEVLQDGDLSCIMKAIGVYLNENGITNFIMRRGK